MTYERFLKVVLGLQKAGRDIQKANKLKIDLYDFIDPYHAIITELIMDIYGEEGYDWFSWFCYESDFGQKDWSKYPSYKTNDKGEIEIEYEDEEVRFGAYDEEGNPICYSIESLYQYLEENHKK
jgi:hypothetical protein